MKIIKLSDCTNFHFKQIEILDQKMVDCYGVSFSDETWTEKHFRLWLPQKFEWSRVAINEETNEILGFCIVSNRFNAVYIHRFVAIHALNTPHIGDAMLRELITEHNIKPFYLLVSTLNTTAIAFYEKYDFNIFTYKPGIVALIGDENDHVSRGEINADLRFMMFRRVDDFNYVSQKSVFNMN